MSEKDNRQAATEAAHRCMAQLKEHWQNVTITCMSIDHSGCTSTVELEWGDEKDEDA